MVLGGGLRKNAKEYGGLNQLNTFTLERVRYGAWLAKRTGLPVLVSGGALFEGASEAQVMANTLRDEYGVQARWVESKSVDTHANATESAVILRANGVSRILLVTHAWHMRRALEDFRSVHLEPTAAPTSFARVDGELEYGSFIPDGKYFYHSTLALHEWLGVVWEQVRGP